MAEKYNTAHSQKNSHKSLIQHVNNFTRTMRLKYIFANSQSKSHPFHVKSTWQPPPQSSVAL